MGSLLVDPVASLFTVGDLFNILRHAFSKEPSVTCFIIPTLWRESNLRPRQQYTGSCLGWYSSSIQFSGSIAISMSRMNSENLGMAFLESCESSSCHSFSCGFHSSRFWRIFVLIRECMDAFARLRASICVFCCSASGSTASSVRSNGGHFELFQSIHLASRAKIWSRSTRNVSPSGGVADNSFAILCSNDFTPVAGSFTRSFTDGSSLRYVAEFNA
mmetsp:Transcript_17779/g.32787  ORF Transcript_17779/g.32787 Transcript_17779/m.32787 type:complete len:217 (+) Transcript_17779:471-1121(+)